MALLEVRIRVERCSLFAAFQKGALAVLVIVGLGGAGGAAGVGHAAEAQLVDGPGLSLADAEVGVLRLLQVVVDDPELLVRAEDEELLPAPRSQLVLDGLQANVPLGIAVVLALPLPRAPTLQHHLLLQQLHYVPIYVRTVQPALQNSHIRKFPHPTLHFRHVVLYSPHFLDWFLQNVEESEGALEHRGHPLEQKPVENGKPGTAGQVDVGEETDEPLKDKGNCDDKSVLALHVPYDLPHLCDCPRMGDLQHFEEEPDQCHGAVHRRIEIAGQQLLRYLFENEKGLTGRPSHLQQKQDHSVHALTIPNVRIVPRNPLQNLRQLRSHSRLPHFELGL